MTCATPDRSAGRMTRLDLDMPVLSPIPSKPTVFCVHFSADGRSQDMWFLDADWAPDRSSFSSRWSETGGIVRRGELLHGGQTLCDAVLLLDHAARASDEAWEAYWFARDRDALLAEGLSRSQAALLAAMRDRPLLATFARHAVLPPPALRRAHRLLVDAAADAAV